MSEVSDATQIIVVAGRAFYMLGKIDLKLAMQIIKLINTVYLSKWKGKAGLGRLRQIKGDDLMYLNVGSENKAEQSEWYPNPRQTVRVWKILYTYCPI